MTTRFKGNEKISFYIRLSLLIMVFLFLVIDLITAIYFPLAEFANLTYGERVAAYYALFTTESNYMVAIYFAIYLYNSYFKKSLPSFQVQLAVTVYITITMVIFWFGIFTAYQNPAKYNVYNWFNTLILHLIMPISMITSFILTSGHNQINITKWHHNYLWIIAIYPAVYSIVVEIRGYLRRLDWIASGGTTHLPSTWYPYPFLNVFQPDGWLLGLAAFVVIFGLVFGLQYFYIAVNNLMFSRRQSENIRIENYYLKTLEKLGKRKRKKKK